MPFSLEPLPVPGTLELETPAVLRLAARAHRALAELKGAAATIPNESILIDTLALQEAKDSSAIENIVTTEDQLFQGDVLSGHFPSAAAKEVHHYAAALKIGLARVREQRFLRLADVLEIQAALEQNRAGLRKLPGTVLKNQQTGDVVYQPPQDPAEIQRLMANFLDHFHRDEPDDPDPLVRMAVLHYQFESIHPFYDGNGRTGRILNLLHLVLHGLLDLPVLYLSRYIVRHKPDYYRGLQAVREEDAWEAWVIYMLTAVEETSRATLTKVRGIRDLMQTTKQRLRRDLPKIYSQELLNNLFRHPYTKIEFIERDLGVSRPTATKYLGALEAAGLVRKTKLGRTNFYVNESLFELLQQ
ncbi:MAG: Fic/DOC family N-terminal domain-containing protein [Sulfuritalea sp.]|nr:Fic/DOC family N-terminal domain-containing protein [Sulfuritalea sp.]